MNKFYYDSIKKLEICDCSGIKDIEQLKIEFNCPDLIDVTSLRKEKEEANRLILEEEKLREEQKKQSAITKLLNLGLTQEEINSLIK